jgi:hypothetical protein
MRCLRAACRAGSGQVPPLPCGHGVHTYARAAAAHRSLARGRSRLELPGSAALHRARPAHGWKRMTLYGATDGADMLDLASLMIAAYLERTGAVEDTTGWTTPCEGGASLRRRPPAPVYPGVPALRRRGRPWSRHEQDGEGGAGSSRRRGDTRRRPAACDAARQRRQPRGCVRGDGVRRTSPRQADNGGPGIRCACCGTTTSWTRSAGPSPTASMSSGDT